VRIAIHEQTRDKEAKRMEGRGSCLL